MWPVLFIAGLFLWIYSILDVVTTDESLMRNLPKLPWLLIVLFFPTVGSIVWLVAGRPAGASFRLGDTSARPSTSSPLTGMRPPLGRPPGGPEDNPEFMKRVDEERLQRWEEELRRREEELRRREEGGQV